MTTPRRDGIEGITADVRTLMVAQEAYRSTHGHYAPSLEAIMAEWLHTFHAPHVEIRGDASGFVVTARDDSLRPGPSRCTCHVGEMAAVAGVPPGRLVTE